jgi:lipooligosaccharide transport system permease protein
VLERNILVYRRSWIFFVSGFFEPLFYLLSIGVGLSHLVGPSRSMGGHTVAYTAFVAPGLLASSAMNGAIFDSTFLVFMKLKIAKTYDAMLATPLAVGDIALGELSWVLLRFALYSGAFLCIMAALGYVVSPGPSSAGPPPSSSAWPSPRWGWPGPPTCGPGRTSTRSRWPSSPCSCSRPPSIPSRSSRAGSRLVVRCTPLYQGVVLERAADLGIFNWSLLFHIAYLAAMAVGGVVDDPSPPRPAPPAVMGAPPGWTTLRTEVLGQ